VYVYVYVYVCLCVCYIISGAWGYYSKANALKQSIERAYPDVEVSADVGRSSSFEVTLIINDAKKLIFSKLESKTFPDSKVIVDTIKKEANMQ